MPVNNQGASTWRAGTTDGTVAALPVHVAKDLLVFAVFAKPTLTAVPPVFSDPGNGWTLGGSGSNGSGALQGVDAGELWVSWWWKRATSASETVPSTTVTNGNVTFSTVASHRSNVGIDCIVEGVIAGDTTSATSFALAGSNDIQAGDRVRVLSAIAGNNATYNATWTVSATSGTIGAVVKIPASDGATANGNALAASGATAPVTAGSGSTTVTWSNTLSAAQTGVGVLLRVREVVLGSQATETDTANAGSLTISQVGSQATELDTANAGGHTVTGPATTRAIRINGREPALTASGRTPALSSSNREPALTASGSRPSLTVASREPALTASGTEPES